MPHFCRSWYASGAPCGNGADGRLRCLRRDHEVSRADEVALGGALLAGLAFVPVAVTGLISSRPAAASGSPATAPGSYTLTDTEVTPTPATYSGHLTILSNGSFTYTTTELPVGVSCDGVWTATGNYIAMDVTGQTGSPGCIGTATALAFVGHLYKKGIKAGTLEAWLVDGSGNPTSFAASGTWNALRTS